MQRRDFFRKAGLGTAAFAALPSIGGAPALAKAGPSPSPQGQSDEAHGHHGAGDNVDGPLANATVTFGAWDTESLTVPNTIDPLDRFPNLAPRTRNFHHLLPRESKIKAGGSVNFVISGFHMLLVYDNGVEPTDIDITKLVPDRPAPPPLIDDPLHRIYRGLDPASLLMPPLPGTTTPLQSIQDRVEVVRFPVPGRFLVICGVLPHFFDPVLNEFVMYGYVRVVK